MKKFLIIISIMLFLVPGLVYASPWSLDDAITISWGTPYNSYLGGSGGLATITNTTKNQTITTFCIELDEYTSNSPRVFDTSNDTAIWGGRNTNSGDQLSGSTKWLFAQYKESAAGYQDIGALTYSIWYLEEEYYDKASTPADWKTWFVAQGGSSSLADIVLGYIKDAGDHSTYQNAGILALDTYNGLNGSGGTQGQSFIFPVPEPGILILLGIAMSAIGAASWRIRKL